MSADFVHLHVHSEYSLLDGFCRIDGLLDRVLALGMKHVALTDHGNMHGAIHFYKEARARGINPILGCELYLAPGSRLDRQSRKGDETAHHLVLLAATDEGYANLVTLVSRAWLEGFHYKPRIDKEILKQHAAGLIGMSACLAGELPRLLAAGQRETARAAAREYQEILGPGNFYLELMDNGLPEQEAANRALIALSRETGVPLVATCDAHYLTREAAAAQDVLLCINTNAKLDDPKRLKFAPDQFSLRTPAEMAQRFAAVPEALANTVRIAERCRVTIEMGKHRLPAFPLPAGEANAPNAYLRKLCVAALPERYPGEKEAAKATARLEHELGVIEKTGFANYFLIVWDFIRHAREQGIAVGPGRGSGVGSLVAYLLRITSVDPLRYGLLFERFLNPERINMPDLDIDFDDRRRDEVIRYVAEKYGRDRVASICTLMVMKARAAIRDVARVLGLPLTLVDEAVGLFPDEPQITIADALARAPELATFVNRDPVHRRWFDFARQIEGTPRNWSVHASAVVIANRPLMEIVPMMRKPETEMLVTQYEMGPIEELGLLKMDFLGLKTISHIGECLRLIREHRGVELTPEAIPLDDPRAMDLLCAGNTGGIFQVESGMFRDLLVKLCPRRFEDVVAVVALGRPGPLQSGMVDDYLARHHGQAKAEYLHPKLKPLLEETHGMIVYQEQVMQIAEVMAGYSLGEADLLRRAMGKKVESIMQAQRADFIARMVKRRHPEELAVRLYDLIEKFAEYGFNKSHSAAYAVITCQTAWLKAHYPLEFMAALLSANLDDTDKIVKYLADCRANRIAVRLPDLNRSNSAFSCEGDAIRFGLAAIRHIGVGVMDAITAERDRHGPFADLHDFCARTVGFGVNRKVIETLIKGGTMDGLGPSRERMLAAVDEAVKFAQSAARDREVGQFSLFGEEPPAARSWPEAAPWTDNQRLAFEKETLGFYASGHPLAGYTEILERFATCHITELSDRHLGKTVRVGGMLAKLDRKVDKRNQPYALLILEGLEGQAELIAFSREYERYEEQFKVGNYVMIEASFRQRRQKDNVPQLRLNALYPLAEAPARLTAGVEVQLKEVGLTEEVLAGLQRFLAGTKTGLPVVFVIETAKRERVRVRAGGEYRIADDPARLADLARHEGVAGWRYLVRPANGE